MGIFDEYLDLLRSHHAELRKLLTDLPVATLDWSPGESVNSIAVLAAHLAGSNRYWLVEVLGNRESQRAREAEFSTRQVDGIELASRLDASLNDLTPIVAALTLEELTRARFSPMHGRDFSVAWILAHALEHTAQHVGHAQVTAHVAAQIGQPGRTPEL